MLSVGATEGEVQDGHAVSLEEAIGFHDVLPKDIEISNFFLGRNF